MGASQSTEAEEGVTVVSHGGVRQTSAGGGALLSQLEQLGHSLPIIPEAAETAGSWSKALQRASPASTSAPPLPRLDGEPLEQMVTEYQRFSRWHCRRIVEKQERLNAAIPLVERQAARLQHRLADAVRERAGDEAAHAAAVEVQTEVEAVAARLARLQQSLADLDAEIAQQTGSSISSGS